MCHFPDNLPKNGDGFFFSSLSENFLLGKRKTKIPNHDMTHDFSQKQNGTTYNGGSYSEYPQEKGMSIYTLKQVV